MANKILVVGSASYGRALAGVGDLTGDTTAFISKPEGYKLVLFTGGADVDPSFYGDTSPKLMCHSNIERDKFERVLFKYALDNDIPMAGICRGLQFINVMAGGKLIHHLDGHAGGWHDLECQKDDKIRRVNTLHHQMVIPPKDALIVGWSKTKHSNRYFGDGDKEIKWKGPEVEAVIYPTIVACGAQWHPEMMSAKTDGYTFFRDMVVHMLSYEMPKFISIYTGKMEKHALQAHT